MKSKTVLIVGGSSSVGIALKSYLTQFTSVFTAGRTECDYHLDLNDPVEKWEFPKSVDVVVHAAADFGGNSSTEMQNAVQVNINGTLKLLQACLNAQVSHFILISSIFSDLPSDSPFYNIYSITKQFTEKVSEFFSSRNNLALTIIRPSQIYGSEERFRKHQPFFYKMIDNAESGEDIYIYGKNDPIRNYIHIDDLILIISRVIEEQITGVFSCQGIEDLTYSQIANTAIKEFDTFSQVMFLIEKDDIPNNSLPLNHKLYELIKYYPKIKIKEGIKKIVSYRRSK